MVNVGFHLSDLSLKSFEVGYHLERRRRGCGIPLDMTVVSWFDLRWVVLAGFYGLVPDVTLVSPLLLLLS